MTRRNQKDRIYHRVTARNGVRIILPSGTDPFTWIFKHYYTPMPRLMEVATPLLKQLRKTGKSTAWGGNGIYFDVVLYRAGVAK